MTDQQTERTVTRRTILWSVPVVTLATAAPAFATSTEPAPAPKCEVKGWRTNHGHKDEDPGTHHYHLRAGCGSEKIAQVTIGGVEAQWDPEEACWTARIIRGGVDQPVVVSTEVAVRFDGMVKFEPGKP